MNNEIPTLIPCKVFLTKHPIMSYGKLNRYAHDAKVREAKAIVPCGRSFLVNESKFLNLIADGGLS